MKGTQEVEADFNQYAGEKGESVIIDLSGVPYIASIGIRLFLTNIKKLAPLGKKMVVLRPQKMVEEVFKLTGVDSIIRIEHDDSTAADFIKEA